MIKRFLASLAVLALLLTGTGLLATASPVYAVDLLSTECNTNDSSNNATGGTPAICKDNQAAQNNGTNPLVGPDGLLTKYIHILALVIGIGAVVMIILAGLRFVTSQGEPDNVQRARESILYAVVGLVVASLAQTLVTFVLSKL